ncbi:MAG: hypothetical protein ACT443_15120 [Gemmatimonadota bacterium]
MMKHGKQVRRATTLLLATAPLLAACGEDEKTGQAETRSAAESQSGTGMQDMQMMQHMQMMQGMSPDSLRALMPRHRQMVANMIAQMNEQMGEMNMATDQAWNALVDSIRTDLRRMPEMSAAEMHALMPDHHRRVMRLMESHRSMERTASGTTGR